MFNIWDNLPIGYYQIYKKKYYLVNLMNFYILILKWVNEYFKMCKQFTVLKLS